MPVLKEKRAFSGSRPSMEKNEYSHFILCGFIKKVWAGVGARYYPRGRSKGEQYLAQQFYYTSGK
ncbi:hypothetical protein ABFV99_23275 [Cytobacillus horneckiae]